jgi:hypothetical protein
MYAHAVSKSGKNCEFIVNPITVFLIKLYMFKNAIPIP